MDPEIERGAELGLTPTFDESKDVPPQGGDDVGLNPTSFGGTSPPNLSEISILHEVSHGPLAAVSPCSPSAGEGLMPLSTPACSTSVSTGYGMPDDFSAPTLNGGTDSSFSCTPLSNNLFYFDAPIASAPFPAEVQDGQGSVTHRRSAGDSDVHAPTHPERRDAETRARKCTRAHEHLEPYNITYFNMI